MITTVCMNPCFDKYASVPALRTGEVNRMEKITTDLGGKGVNVAVALRRLGTPARCVCCVGEESVPSVEPLLRAEGIESVFLTVPGKVRTNLKIKDEATKTITEFNEAGITLSEEQLARFLELLSASTVDSEYVVLSGSLPNGCSSKTYKSCLETLSGKKCVLDASGNSLLYGISASPFLIKPNLSEMEGIMKKELHTLRAIRDAGRLLMDYGAQNVIVSMGRYGAMLVMKEISYFAPALSVKALSTVGAGDSMVGGIMHGLMNGLSLPEAFRCGVAAGTASVMAEGTQSIHKEDYVSLLARVTVQEV